MEKRIASEAKVEVQTNQEEVEQHEQQRHQQLQGRKGHMQQAQNCEQGGEKQPTLHLKVQNSLMVVICKSSALTSKTSKNYITSPGISTGKAANESITSDTDIATVFLSTATNPML